jgi:hypothetical protein
MTAEERTELAVTGELDTPVDGCIVIEVWQEICAMLESHVELNRV